MSEQRLAALEARCGIIEAGLRENTAMTREVLDTLRAFKMIGTIAKWGAAIVGFVLGAYHGLQTLFHLGGK